MSHVPTFGKRGRPPGGPGTPAGSPPKPRGPKRSNAVRLTVMAGAGAAALGFNAMSGGCSERYYDSKDACLRDNIVARDICNSAFGGADPAGRVVFRGSSYEALRRDPLSGQFTRMDGSTADLSRACQSGQTRSSHSGRWASSSRSWSSSTSSSSSSDSGWTIGKTLRGGFGATGRAVFSGGG